MNTHTLNTDYKPVFDTGSNRGLSEAPLLPEDEIRILHDWNNTDAPLPPQECLHHLVEAQVELTPDAVALVCGEERLTYRELNRRANRLAHHLRAEGVGPEVLVGVCLERSAEMVTALLAILKAGGAYLPLDPAYPAERLQFLLDDAGLRVIVTQQQLTERLRGAKRGTRRLLLVDTEGPAIASAADDNLTTGVRHDNLAYVLYTSGSTGQPKGVAIEHRSPVALVDWARRTFHAEDLAGVVASSSIGFDLSVFELFVPLSSGGQVLLVENLLALPRLAAEATLIFTVPSVLVALLQLESLPASVLTVLLAGEPLPRSLAQPAFISWGP